MKPRELDMPFFEATLIPPVRRLTETILGHHLLHLPDSPDAHTSPVPNPQPPPHLHRPEAKELPKNS